MAKQMKQEVTHGWIEQYILDAEHDELKLYEDIDGVQLDYDRLRNSVNPYDSHLEVGQIRILAPKFVRNQDHIPYVAVIAQTDETHYLVAPFSRFPIPATPGEIMTHKDFEPVKVLQVWNARIVPEALLQLSWKSDVLEEQTRQDAEALHQYLQTKTPLPENFSSILGPRLDAPFDLRYTYLDEEEEQFVPLDSWSHIHQAVSQMSKNMQRPVRLAAAGDELRSDTYVFEDDACHPLTTAEMADFDRVSQGDPIPQWYWSADLTPDYEHASLIFRLAKTQDIIGMGQVQLIEGKTYFSLLESLAPNGAACDITTPNDIQIFIHK